MRQRSLILTSALCLLPAFSSAQRPPPTTGDVLRVYPRSDPARPVVVTLLSLRSDSLIAKYGTAGDTLRVGWNDVSRLEIRTGTASRWVLGAGIGAGAGLLAGAVIGAAIAGGEDSDLDGLYPIFGAVVGIPAGALIGGVIGANSRRDQWSELNLDQVRLRLIAGRHAGIGLRLSWRF